MGRKKKPTDEELKAQVAALEAEYAALVVKKEEQRAEIEALHFEVLEGDAGLVGLLEANIALLRSKLERYEVRLAFHRARMKATADSMTLGHIRPLAENPTAAFDRRPDPTPPETAAEVVPEDPAPDAPAPE